MCPYAAGVEVLARSALSLGRVPSQRARSRGAVGKERHGGVGDDAHVVVDAAVQHHLGEDGEVGGGGEESRVTGDAAKREGVLVVHLALERIAARRGDFGGRDAVPHRVGREEERVVHPERLEDALGEEDVEAKAGDRLDDPARVRRRRGRCRRSRRPAGRRVACR